MALSLFSIWQSFQSFVNTSQSSFYRPNTDFVPAVNDISFELWNEWTALAEKSQDIRDNLRPFLKSKNVIIKPSSSMYGILTPPDGYDRFSSARIIVTGNNCCIPCKDIDNGSCANGDFKTDEEIADEYYDSIVERNVELIDNIKWAACLSHLTKCPTFENPKMTQVDGGFKVAPRKVSVIVLDYYKEPSKGTFDYSIASGDTNTGAGDYLIYNAATSKKLEWHESVINEFVIRLGIRFGVFTREQFLTAATQNQKKRA